MHRRTARGNRLGLAVTGLLLLAAGGALLLASRGLLGAGSDRAGLYPERARRLVADGSSWLWPVLAAAALLLALACLRWLLVQPRTDRLRHVVVDTYDRDDRDDRDDTDGALGGPAPGRTRMPAHAVTDAIEDDLAALPGVRRATAALAGPPDAPELWLAVSTDADADLGRVRAAVVDRVVADARSFLDRPDLVAQVRLTVTRRSGDRVLS